jgi:hypothetical protein
MSAILYPPPQTREKDTGLLTIDRLARRFGSVIGRRGSQRGPSGTKKAPRRGRVGACDLGALGGTRTAAF